MALTIPASFDCRQLLFAARSLPCCGAFGGNDVVISQPVPAANDKNPTLSSAPRLKSRIDRVAPSAGWLLLFGPYSFWPFAAAAIVVRLAYYQQRENG